MPILHGWTATVKPKRTFHGFDPVLEWPPSGKGVSCVLDPHSGAELVSRLSCRTSFGKSGIPFARSVCSARRAVSQSQDLQRRTVTTGFRVRRTQIDWHLGAPARFPFSLPYLWVHSPAMHASSRRLGHWRRFRDRHAVTSG